MHAHTLARLELEEIKTELRILIGEKETCLHMNASVATYLLDGTCLTLCDNLWILHVQLSAPSGQKNTFWF